MKEALQILALTVGFVIFFIVIFSITVAIFQSETGLTNIILLIPSIVLAYIAYILKDIHKTLSESSTSLQS